MNNQTFMSTDKLANLFTLFAFGTISLFISIYLPGQDQLTINLKLGLILITILTYELVFIALVNFQIIKGKNKLIKSFISNREKYFVSMVFLLSFTYLVIVWTRTNDIVNVLQNLIIIVIAIFGIPQTNKMIMRLWNKIGSKQKIEEVK